MVSDRDNQFSETLQQATFGNTVIHVDDVLHNKRVQNVCDFGAFIRIADEDEDGISKDGLLHISQMSQSRIHDIHEHIKKGDVIPEIRVKAIQNIKGVIRISLTLLPKRESRDY